MPLISILKRGGSFFVAYEKRRLPEDTVKKVGKEIYIKYPKDSWFIMPSQIKSGARKQGLSHRDYNAYTETMDNLHLPKFAQIQLYLIPEDIARKEHRDEQERALDGLWKLAGYD